MAPGEQLKELISKIINGSLIMFCCQIPTFQIGNS